MSFAFYKELNFLWSTDRRFYCAFLVTISVRFRCLQNNKMLQSLKHVLCYQTCDTFMSFVSTWSKYSICWVLIFQKGNHKLWVFLIDQGIRYKIYQKFSHLCSARRHQFLCFDCEFIDYNKTRNVRRSDFSFMGFRDITVDSWSFFFCVFLSYFLWCLLDHL